MPVAALLAALAVALPLGGPSAARALPVDRLVGQRMVFAYDGLTPPVGLRKRIRRGEAAGVILFSRNIASPGRLRRTIAGLQRIPRPAAVDAPLLVLVDQEGGPVRRLPGAPEQGAAATRSAAQAAANGRAAGRNLAAAGVNVDLAPVADVARSGSALEREGRTYGRSARHVTALASAFARGLGAQHVAATYKHFPGFGAATVNTDDAPARIGLSLPDLRRVDLRPYAHPPSAVRLVMVSTAVYPALDPRPAAFSRRWATGELRHRLRFGGVTISDDLQAASVARFGTPAQLAYFAARAGIDLPLFAQDYRTGARAAMGLERALRAGRLSRAEATAAAQRVLALRRALR